MCNLSECVEKRGIEKGIKEGVGIGADKHLISQIAKKLKKGKSIEIIAEDVEEEVSVIMPIFNVAQKYAPDYDVDAIYEELSSTDQKS